MILRGGMLRGAVLALAVAAAALPSASCRRAGADAKPGAAAADLTVELLAPTNAVAIGTPVRVTARIVHPVGARLDLPDPGRGKTLVVRDRKTATRAAGPARELTTVDWTLASFEVGDHEVFTGAVKAVRADGTATEQPWPLAVVRVASSLGGTNDAVRPLKGPVLWPPAFPRWLWALPLVALLALAAALAAAFLLRRAKAPAPPPPLPPAHRTALAALERLRAGPWMERGEAEPFYVELSRIVRRYLEDRFGLRAPEQTTEEFIRDTAASDRLSPSHRDMTAGFLEQSDRVKFAREAPGRADMEAAFGAAERLVRETAAPEGEPAADAAAVAGPGRPAP